MLTKIARLAVPVALAAAVASCASGETAADTTTAPTPASTTTTTTASSAAPSPEDAYLAMLARAGDFPGSEGEARALWLSRGQDACRQMELTGDVVQARFATVDALADWSPQGQGRAEPGLAERAITLVDAAMLHLCPDVAAQ